MCQRGAINVVASDVATANMIKPLIRSKSNGARRLKNQPGRHFAPMEKAEKFDRWRAEERAKKFPALGGDAVIGR
jgi:hypothetical protein